MGGTSALFFKWSGVVLGTISGKYFLEDVLDGGNIGWLPTAGLAVAGCLYTIGAHIIKYDITNAQISAIRNSEPTRINYSDIFRDINRKLGEMVDYLEKIEKRIR